MNIILLLDHWVIAFDVYLKNQNHRYPFLTYFLMMILDHRAVAFDVRLKDSKRNLATKARVVFETVDLNERQGYNVSTGIFTAPSGGIYVFDWTTLTFQGQVAYTSLIVNDQYKSWNYCRDSNSNTHLLCSKMTVVKLRQGDKAWIGVSSGPANMYRKYTSFSGYKL